MATDNTKTIKVSDSDAFDVRALESKRASACLRYVAIDVEIAKLEAAKAKVTAEVVAASKEIAGLIDRFRARYDVPAGREYDYAAGTFLAPPRAPGAIIELHPETKPVAETPTTSEGG